MTEGEDDDEDEVCTFASGDFQSRLVKGANLLQCVDLRSFMRSLIDTLSTPLVWPVSLRSIKCAIKKRDFDWSACVLMTRNLESFPMNQ